MSTYKSCWRWSVSQFSICMSLMRHGGQRYSFGNSQADSQMYTFPDQFNWQFVQIIMDSKFQSKLCVLDTDDVKRKTSLFSVQGKSVWYCFMVFCSFVLHHLCPVHKIIHQTRITAILGTHLLRYYKPTSRGIIIIELLLWGWAFIQGGQGLLFEGGLLLID